ncbi:family 43 glycosylhydrolase [Mariniflexile sp. AS56]|uniref:family 43 glycosylhydrolase n=1 Tax=Mariniflexile sp. AS56 TaxID=3063957 RepID=UPI0026EA3936|nr:family 43 glycosylhydrolase [Mariniflexile sp. AS56]MDO7172472.1 family 43 glycosylhydrolase [Mariniflexile sp. AS56]
MRVKIFFTVLILALQLTAQNRRSNPFVSHMFTADPSAHVWDDGRLYVYPSTDNAPPKGYKTMDGYHVFSTDDMIKWKDHGEILHSRQVDWGREEGGFMWAPDCAYKDGVYYYYFPHPTGADFRKTWKIGVATSSKPTTDFKVQGYIEGLEAYIDPCVFIDDDGQAYLYIAGHNQCYGVKLKENMTEIDGELIKQTGLDGLREGPFVFKRNNMYYMIYPDDFPKFNKMRYAMSKSPLGPWENNEVFLGSTDVITTHGSVVEYKGQWYLFYHNGNLSGGIGPNRSICFDPIFFNEDGTINMVEQTLGVQLPTFHKEINFNGMMGALSEGDYNQAELQKQGIQPKNISSIEIPKGYKIEGFEEDNFTGKSWVFVENRINLNAIGCKAVIKSLKISKFKDENLVKNASFELATEEHIKNWISRSAKFYNRFLDNSAKGYYAMQYKGKGNAKANTQNIELTPNTNYQLSVKLKVDSGTNGKVIFDTNGSFDESCKFELDSNTKADKWVEFKGVFNSGNLSKIELRCLMSDDFNGVCYWDEVILKAKLNETTMDYNIDAIFWMSVYYTSINN